MSVVSSSNEMKRTGAGEMSAPHATHKRRALEHRDESHTRGRGRRRRGVLDAVRRLKYVVHEHGCYERF